MNYRTLTLIAATLLLAACSHTTDSASASAAAVPASPAPAHPKDAALHEAEALTADMAESVHDVPSCLAATVSGKSDFGAWPAKAFASYLDPTGFKEAHASADGFKETDLETNIKPKADGLIAQLNPKRTPYIGYEVDGDAAKILPYGTFWNTHHGFAVNSTVFTSTPVYSADGTSAQCVVDPPSDSGLNGSFAYVQVPDEPTARTISALVAQHQVHPRFLMKVTSWYPAGYENAQTTVHIIASILKVQLIGPDGKVLAESTGVTP